VAWCYFDEIHAAEIHADAENKIKGITK